MKKIRLLFLTFVALMTGISASATKTVYVDPVGTGTWMNGNAKISLYVWGDGGNTWASSTTLSDGVIKFTFDDEYDKMIISRGENQDAWGWNKTEDITSIQLNKLYKANGFNGEWMLYTVEDYTEPSSTGYVVDFNTAITTGSHDFAVASNWGHIVGSNNYDNYGPYYMSYNYSTNGGVDGTGALNVGAQNGYYMGSTQSQANFSDGSYDYLITPRVNGTVTLKVKRYNVSGYSSYVKIFAVDEAGTTVGNELETVITPAISDSEWSTLTLVLNQEQRLAIRAQSVVLDDFTAESATIVPVPGMTITSVKRANNGTTTYFDMNADGSYTVKYKVKVKNTGDAALVAGVTENYSLSVSISGTLYGSFNVPCDLAVGEESEEFLATFTITAPTGWKDRYVAENLTNTTYTANSSSWAWSNTLAYNPVPFFIKQGNEPINYGSSLTSVTSLDFGMISEAKTENYEIFAHNAGDLLVKSITVTGDFTVVPAETLPYTITAHTGMNVDVTANATETSEGVLTITYVDKNGADATTTVTLKQTVLDASKWVATFDGGIWPEGTIHQSSLSLSSNSYYGYTYAIKSSSSYSNKFFTPLLHATAGESMTFDAMLDYNSGSIKVYVTTDRNDLGTPVLTLGSSQLNTSSMTSQSLTIAEEGDYYVVFEVYNAMLDNLYGFEPVAVAHDIMVNSFILSGTTAVDKTVQSGDVLSPKFEILPVQSEAAGAYSVKLYANNEVVATIADEDLTALTAGTAKTFTFSYTPVVTTTTTFETYAAIEFADATVVNSGTLNLTVTCEPVFVFFNAGTTVGSSQPSSRSTAITFGTVQETGLTQNFEVYNWGTAPLTVKSITVPEGYSVNVNEATVTPKERQAVDITFSATTPGTYEGNLSIVYVDKDGADQTFTLPISGRLLDSTKWYANFDNTTDNIKWPAGSVYQSNVSNTYRGTYSDNNYFIYNSSYTTNNMFITPKLSATANEEFQFDAAPQSQYYDGYIKIYTSTDRETWGEPIETIEMTKGANYTETNTFVTKTVAMPAGEYYVGVQMYYAKVDELFGLTLVDVAHDLVLATPSIPAEGTQNAEYTASVNVKNFGLADDEATVTAYVNNEAVATSAAVALPMNHKLTDAGTQLPVSFVYPKAGEYQVYLEVKAGETVVASTEPVNVTFAEEVPSGELSIEAAGADSYCPLALYYKNSESVCFYSADVLKNNFGLANGNKINSITFKGYSNTTHTSNLQVWYEWTDDIEQVAMTGSNQYNTDGMTQIISSSSYNWPNVGGNAADLKDLLVLNFTEPLTYEGKALRIVMRSTVDGYKNGFNWAKSSLDGAYRHYNDGTAGTFTGTWAAAKLPAINIAIEAVAPTLSGIVGTSAGAGIEGASVTLKAANGVEYSGTTDGTGAYSMNVIQAGLDFTVTVEADGYLKKQFAYDKSTTLDVTLFQQMGLVGTFPGFPGLGSTGSDIVMTQSAEDPMIFTYIAENVELEGIKYEYKMRADGNWASSLASGYELPASGNNDWQFGTTMYPAGTYKLTFTANTSAHTLTLQPVLQLTLENSMAEALNYENAPADVTVARTLKAGWNAIVLPFSLSAEEIAATFGENVEVADFKEASRNGDDVHIEFTKAESISAGKPCLLHIDAAPAVAPKFEGKTVNFALNNVEGEAFDFVGCFADGAAAAGDFIMAGGKFKKAAGGNAINAYRSYLKLKTDGVRSVSFYFDGVLDDDLGTTGIADMNTDLNTNGGIYNLSGQKVTSDGNANLNVKKGVYIINGKKVVIK